MAPPEHALLTLRSPIALIKERFESGEHSTPFTFHAPNAGNVFIAGTFNNWDAKRTPLIKQPTGIWQTELQLSPGAYEYRFIVDGVWQEDPTSKYCQPNPFGGQNSVVIIKD